MAFCALWGLTNVRLTTNLAPCHSTRAVFYRLCLLLTEIETSENGGKGALPPHTISTPTTFQSDYNKSWWRDIWLQRTSLCGDLIRREWSNPPFFICSSLSAPQGCKTASDFCPPFLSDVMDLQQPQPGARTQTDQLSRGGKMAESEESVGGREGGRENTQALTVYLRVFLKTKIVFRDIQKLKRTHKFIRVSSTMANVSVCSDIRGFQFIWWQILCSTVEGRMFQAKILFGSHRELFSDYLTVRTATWCLFVP